MKPVAVTIIQEQYDAVTMIAALNKMLGIKPSTVSAVVREALDSYLEDIGWDYKDLIGNDNNNDE